MFEPDRRTVEAAAAYMADEDTGIGFLYSGWCQAALPHRRLPDDKEWQIRSEHVNMVVAPGHRSSSFGDAQKIGVPYGSRARLIRMGVPIGGKSMLSIKDQAERISRCSFTFDLKGDKFSGIGRMNIFDKAIFADGGAGEGGQFPQIPSYLNNFEQLTSHPVPLDEAAVRAISNNSMALDFYAWLSYRLHALKGVTPVSWTALKGQFGGGFDSMRHFRQTFAENLRLALTVYRDARVEMTERGWICFRPSLRSRRERSVPVESRPEVPVKSRFRVSVLVKPFRASICDCREAARWR